MNYMKIELDNNGKFARQLNNNNYEDRGEYFEVSVKNTNLIYMVDSEYIEWMKKYTWYSGDRNNHPYLLAKENSGIGKRRTLIFHIEIMNYEIDKFKKENKYYEKRVIVDHIDGDCTNNLKSNLRVRTQSENNMNKKIQGNNTTGFVGVSWHKKQKMWSSIISVNGETIYLGSFYYMRNALRARINSENEYFGEHSYYLRDEKYKKRVEEILSLPHIPEPVFFSGVSESDKTGIRGITYNEKGKNKYVVRMQGNPSKSFFTLEEAVNHKDKIWKEKYGDREPMLKNEKIERLV